MGKFNQYERETYTRPYDVHPIWRGIGCVMMVLIPAMSIIGALVLIETGLKEGWPIPADLIGTPRFPSWMYLPVIRNLTAIFQSIDNFYGIVVFSLLFMILGFFIFAFVYSLMYKVIGPPRYTRLDAPNVPRGKRYNR